MASLAFRVWGVLAAGVCVVLSGCTVGYTADVRNTTPQPISAQLVRADPSGQDLPIVTKRIGPGDRDGLSKYNIPDNWQVYLLIDAVGNPGAPARMNLGPGMTIVNVHQEGTSQTGPLSLEQVPTGR